MKPLSVTIEMKASNRYVHVLSGETACRQMKATEWYLHEGVFLLVFVLF